MSGQKSRGNADEDAVAAAAAAAAAAAIISTQQLTFDDQRASLPSLDVDSVVQQPMTSCATPTTQHSPLQKRLPVDEMATRDSPRSVERRHRRTLVVVAVVVVAGFDAASSQDIWSGCSGGGSGGGGGGVGGVSSLNVLGRQSGVGEKVHGGTVHLLAN